MAHTRKILLSALATVALGTALLGRSPEAKESWAAIGRWLMTPFTDPNALEKKLKAAGDKFQEETWAKANAFRASHQYDLVIANETGGEWKFGIIDTFPTQLKDPQSGIFKVAVIRANGLDYKTTAELEMTAASTPVPLESHWGTVVVTPVCEKKNLLSKQKFARVFYLEDANRRRIYLTLTRGTAATDVPVVGVASMSNKALYDDKAIEFNDPQFKRFNMIGIRVNKLK
jgi:hypothetical protein